VPLKTIRTPLLVLALGAAACVPFKRDPPQPINTPELPIATEAEADSLLVDVQRVDSTAIVELRYATSNNFTGTPLPGYEGNHAWLRDEAAVALAVANADLHREGYALKIFDAYRPVRASEAMVAWAQRAGRTDLLRDGYIAARSRHNLGVAVDCTLVELASGRVVGMEALVRWQHPSRGVVPPDEFVGIAEETGLALKLGRWVLGEACSQAASWRDADRPAVR